MRSAAQPQIHVDIDDGIPANLLPPRLYLSRQFRGGQELFIKFGIFIAAPSPGAAKPFWVAVESCGSLARFGLFR